MGLEVLDRLLSWTSVCSALMELLLIWPEEDRLNTTKMTEMIQHQVPPSSTAGSHGMHLMADCRLGVESLRTGTLLSLIMKVRAGLVWG
jgi:hypothetical protein